MAGDISLTLGGVLRQVAARHGDNEALVDLPSGTRYTYAQFDQISDQLAKALIVLGLKPGQRLALWAPNQPEWLIVMYAAAKAGVVLSSVDTNFKAPELAYQLGQSRCAGLVMAPGLEGDEYLEALSSLCPELDQEAPSGLACAELPELKQVIVLGDQAPAGALSWSQALELGRGAPDEKLAARLEAVRPEDVATLLYTSGTTGRPKGVMSPHRGLIMTSLAGGQNQRLMSSDRLVVSVPLCHMFGCICIALAGIIQGSTLVIPSRLPEPGAILNAVVSESCTALYGPPTSFIAMLDDPAYQAAAGGGLRTGIMGGAQCPIEVMHRVVEEMGVGDILIGYGQTEASSWVSTSRPDDPLELRVSTVGRPVPGAEAKIVDPGSGETLSPGEVGEICTRGYVMKGYFDMPAETAQAIDAEGWLHTGDLGAMDAEGYIRISGRLKEVIRKGGRSVFPSDIEEVLFKHPAVNTAQAFGVPHDELGEEVVVWIKLERRASLEKVEVLAYLESKLPDNHLPAWVRFVEEFPMTPMGKIQKFRMREIMLAELGTQEDL
ncbi:MAG: AMP-binding protein [Desulfarculaceae bacterium]|nr:AMP-binding protein [Desulfarculaceae bacterium]MCF8072013.1 AMP-binding protein [Desulfarculaceae bacterium]MCF8101530.1 AMP-binding protein [Desulfarculaceae bacterium]MCF8115080.1 AMP-binding protein [Desulfarculaceae bacterium]